VAGCITTATSAWAGGFDTRGGYHAGAQAVAFLDFSQEPSRYVPEDADLACAPKVYDVITAPAAALTGDRYLRLDHLPQCPERFRIEVPEVRGSYRATAWSRHGALSARVIVGYPDELSIPFQQARMAPTGRTTSDGWVEYASNDFPVDGTLDPLVYIRLYAFGHRDGVDVDAVELVRSGEFYSPQTSCEGLRDPVCGDEGLCVDQRCQLGRMGVPPLPAGDLKDEMVDALQAKLDTFFGGRKTRLQDLPVALASMDQMRDAQTAWQFWNGWGLAMRQLHDWHTRGSAQLWTSSPSHRLNACFIEGVADSSDDVVPSHPGFKDILVSHVGAQTLLAIDGLHPIEWARGLIDVNWGYWSATDDEVFSELVETLGGRSGSIVRFAKTFTVLRCESATQSCEAVPKTIAVVSLPTSIPDQHVSCDNRPTYHLEAGQGPDPDTHRVHFDLFRGRIADTTEEEAIFGMVFDNLLGEFVNSDINAAVADWKQEARGVILDHRAGNGGTIDAPENFTKLVRPQQILAANLQTIIASGFAGPETAEEGIALFNQFANLDPYLVGSPDHDPDLPVALLLHRDGSASDYLPFGMKGAPKTRIFGHAATAGAFSTFISFEYYGGVSFRFGSGDTIAFDGRALIGHGVVPDEVVLQKQSDLIVGVDTLHEAALAWVRQELKP